MNDGKNWLQLVVLYASSSCNEKKATELIVSTAAIVIWYRVPETTLPLETTLWNVYLELWVVTAVPSSVSSLTQNTRSRVVPQASRSVYARKRCLAEAGQHSLSSCPAPETSTPVSGKRLVELSKEINL